MAIAEVNGRRIAHDDTGGGGPAVVFSHGILMDREMFAPQVEALRAEFRCVAWDQRGHADSDDATEPFTYWDSADDLLALADHLGIERAFLVGMSQGGFLSLRAALRRPGFVLGLGLLDTQAGQEAPEQVEANQAMAHVWKEHGLNDDLAEIIAAMIMSPGYAGTPDWIAKWKQKRRIHIDVPLTPLHDREDLHDRLAEITAPAIVIHGEADAAISVDQARALAEGLPNCEGLVVVPSAGHAANLSHPEPVNAALGDFLRRHSRVPAR
jgi:pimeloyl-ACP methyl ester carboxylesterase